MVAEIISEHNHTHVLSFAERSFSNGVLSGFMIHNYTKRTREQPDCLWRNDQQVNRNRSIRWETEVKLETQPPFHMPSKDSTQNENKEPSSFPRNSQVPSNTHCLREGNKKQELNVELSKHTWLGLDRSRQSLWY